MASPEVILAPRHDFSPAEIDRIEDHLYEYNRGAVGRGLYERCGFERVAELVDWPPGHTHIVLRIQLSPKTRSTCSRSRTFAVAPMAAMRECALPHTGPPSIAGPARGHPIGAMLGHKRGQRPAISHSRAR